MSNDAVPPPPPPSAPSPAQPSYSPPPPAPPYGGPPPAKTGLPLWGKIGIGCGCLILIAAAVGIGLLGWGAKKAVDLAKDPAKLAQFVIEQDPDLEVVENDEDSGRFTIRNKKTGEVGTFNYADIKNGNFSFEGDQGKVEIGGETGGVKVTDSEGKETSYKLDSDESGVSIKTSDGQEMRIGQDLTAVPDWVPKYPDADFSAGGMTTVSGDRAQGIISATELTAGLDELEAWYQERLKSDGYEVERSSIEMGGTQQVILAGKKTGTDQLSVVLGREEGKSRISITYAGPAK